MTTTETESNWLSFQAKRVSHKLTEWGFSFKGTEGDNCCLMLIHQLTTTKDFDTNYFNFFSLQPQLMFIGMRVMRPSRKEISSMLFIFTPEELKWTAMRKNWRLNCTTTGLLHILNLVRWWELKNMQFSSFET